MGREILIDESVRNSLVHGDNNQPSFGLLIGAYPSLPSQPLTIVYLAQTKDDSESEETPNSEPPTILTPHSPALLYHHTKQLLRMLPGGLTILGLYVVEATENIFTQKYEQNLKQLLTSLTKQLNKMNFYGAEAEKEKIVFHFNPHGNKFNSRVFDASKFTVLKTFETVFGETEWVKIETDFDTSGVVVSKTGGGGRGGAGSGGGEELRRNLNEVLAEWQKTLEISKVLINRKIPSCEEIYEEESDEISILIEKIPGILLENKKRSDNDFVNHLHIEGMIHSVAFALKGSSTLFLKQSLQTDILRSLASRMEMHCESLIDEELTNESKVYHEIPRRVFVNLVKELVVSDYLFPGEGPHDSVNSFIEILNLERAENDIDLGKERSFDLDELQGLKGSMEELLNKAESISKLPPGLVMSNTRAIAWVFSLAFFVAFLAALLPFFQSKVAQG